MAVIPHEPVPKAAQQRATLRREAILNAAVELLIHSGSAAVSHRLVASKAEASLGSIRYYFNSREELLLACINKLDSNRAGAATRAINTAKTQCQTPEQSTLLILQAYYGFELDDQTLLGTIGWIVDCARESELLSAQLAFLRSALDLQMTELLNALSIGENYAHLIFAIIDGSILTSVAEGKEGIADIAQADLLDFLKISNT